jgi:hypothetical protein
VVTLVLRDDNEVESASKDVAESIAQHWAMFSWDIREATQDEVEWYTGEYEGEEQ